MELKPLSLRYAQACTDRDAWKHEAMEAQARAGELRAEIRLLRAERDVLRRQRDAVVDGFNRLVAERAALETPVYIVNLGRVEMPADWHSQAAEELARAEMSTAGHGDLHDACAPGWLGAAREGGPLL